MRERWFGATGLRVPEIAVEGEDVDVEDDHHVRLRGETYDAVVAETADDPGLARAHLAGVPVLVRADTADAVKDALSRPQVACALGPRYARTLRELDLTSLTYG